MNDFKSQGRPFKKKGKNIVAPMGSSKISSWLAPAQQEHASIASYAALVQDLMAAGAPLDLLERVLRAALDQVVHARSFLDAHKRDSGESVEPQAELSFASDATLTLGFLIKKIQIDTERDCQRPGEQELLTVRILEAVEQNPWLKAYLAQIEEDNRAHKKLAQDIVNWCRDESQRLSVQDPGLTLQK